MFRYWKKIIIALAVSMGVGIAVQDIAVAATIFAVLCIVFSAPLYIKYAQDNPNHLWFKRKLFGWGWTPVTWQGWLVILVYLGAVVLLSLTIDDNSPPREVTFTFILPVLILTSLLICIAYCKGEKPRWEWGKNLKKYE